MATITLTIPDEKLPRVKAGLLRVYPNTEETVDPAWVNTGDQTLPDMVPKYTDNEWLRERIRRFIIDSVKRGEEVAAQEAARKAVLNADDTIS